MWLKLFLWWQYYSSMYNSTLFLVWRIRESGQQKSPFVGNGKSGRNSQLDDRTLIFLFLSSFLTVPWKNFFFLDIIYNIRNFFFIEKHKIPTYSNFVSNTHTFWFLLFYRFFIFLGILYANKICSNAGRMPPIYNHLYGCHGQGFYCCLTATPRQQLSKLCHCKQHYFLSVQSTDHRHDAFQMWTFSRTIKILPLKTQSFKNRRNAPGREYALFILIQKLLLWYPSLDFYLIWPLKYPLKSCLLSSGILPASMPDH